MSATNRAHDAPLIAIAIDENRRLQRGIEDLLASAGFAVVIVSRETFVDAVAEAKADSPDTPILAVSPVGTTGAGLRRALRAGASGIVTEEQIDVALVPSAGAIVAGQLAIPPALGRRLAPRALSHREKQILALVVLGKTNRQIADKLFVAESTVKTHLSSAFAKLETRSRAETAALILDPEEGHDLGVLSLTTLESEQAA